MRWCIGSVVSQDWGRVMVGPSRTQFTIQHIYVDERLDKMLLV